MSNLQIEVKISESGVQRMHDVIRSDQTSPSVFYRRVKACLEEIDRFVQFRLGGDVPVLGKQDESVKIQDELTKMQIESISQTCRRTGVQRCHMCEDLCCCDNTSAAKYGLEKLAKSFGLKFRDVLELMDIS